MLKKFLYVAAGFVGGVLFAVGGVGELRAQHEFDDNSKFTETVVKPSVPGRYGRLVAVSGIDMYFSADDGTVYLVRPRTNGQLDTSVTVIKRY